MAEGAGAGAGANDQDDDPYAALVDPRTYDASRVDAQTKARYLRRRRKFIRWTRAKHPEWILCQCDEECDEGLCPDGEVDLVAMAGENGGDAEAFQAYVCTNKGLGDRVLARHSTLTKERSMLYDYIYDLNLINKLRPAFWTEMKIWYISIKKSEAKEMMAGTLTDREGKEDLPVKVYSSFCHRWLIEKPYKGGVFALAYAVLSWQLMARTNNVAKLRFSHLSAQGDSIGARFMITKTDPKGEKHTSIKHMYANPIDPRACVVLSLGIFWLLNPYVEGNLVFGTEKASANFCKLLKKMCTSDGSKLLLEFIGRSPSELGSHSARQNETSPAAARCFSTPPQPTTQTAQPLTPPPFLPLSSTGRAARRTA